MHVVNYDVSKDNVEEVLFSNLDCRWFHYPHKKLDSGKSLIDLARYNKKAYEDLIFLANNGYYIYNVKENNITSFVHHSAIHKTWNRISNGEFCIEDSLVYSFTEPLLKNFDTNLLVIFSSISGEMYQPYLFRYFEQNFSSIQKHISPNTAILRIADMGGVTGAYYLNTNYMIDNEIKIQKLIKKISNKIDAKKTILFGISKGGSGALYHGIMGNYNILAVDPIVDDEFYLTKCNDLHFVREIFKETKKIKFNRIIENLNYSDLNNGCIICSPRSEQYPYISSLLFDKCANIFPFLVVFQKVC